MRRDITASYTQHRFVDVCVSLPTAIYGCISKVQSIISRKRRHEDVPQLVGHKRCSLAGGITDHRARRRLYNEDVRRCRRRCSAVGLLLNDSHRRSDMAERQVSCKRVGGQAKEAFFPDIISWKRQLSTRHRIL